MSNDQLLCWKCHAPLAKAMVRCRQCGSPRTPPANPGQQSGVNRSPVVKVAQEALSLDDMFSMAEDAVEEDVDQFLQSASHGLKQAADLSEQAARPQPARSVAANSTKLPSRVEAPAVEPPVVVRTSTDKSAPPEQPPTNPSQSSAFLPRRTSTPEVTPTSVNRESRRSRLPEAKRATGVTSLSPSVAAVLKQSLKLPAPKLQKVTEKELKARQNAANKALAKAQKLCSKLENDDTKPAIDSLRQMLLELGALKDPAVIPLLTTFLTDARPSLPEAALKALANTRCGEAYEPLVKQLLLTPPDAAGGYLSAFGSLGDRRAVRPLIVCGAEYPQFQMRVVEAINEIGPDAVPILIEVAGSTNPGELLIVCLAFGKLKDDRSLEAISTLLHHELASIRCHAAEALGDIGDNKAVKALIPALRDSDSNVRANVAAALSRIPDERSVIPLMRCLKDSDRQVCLYAIAGLGSIGDKAAVPALTPLLDQNDPEMIAAVCDSLGRLGDPGAIDRLIQFLVIPTSDEHSTLVLKVIETIRRLQASAAVPALIELLQSPDANLRLKTTEAIGQCKDKSAAEILEHHLASDSSDEVRAAAAKSLGELRDPESFNPLVEALQDTFNVRVKAIIALGLLKNQNAVPYLLPLLKDQSPEIRYHSCQALATLDYKKAIHHIEPLVVDDVPMVARGAMKSIQELGDTRPEKQIIAAAKKRTKAKKASVSSSISGGGGLFDLMDLSHGLMGIIWPEEPHKRILPISIISGMVLLPLIVMSFFLLGPKEFVVQRRGISGADFSPDGQHLYVSNRGGSIEYWGSLQNSNYSSRFFVSRAGVDDLVVTGENEMLALAGTDVFQIKDKTPKPVAQLPFPGLGFQISADRKKAIALDVNNNAYPIDLSTGAGSAAIAIPPETAYCIGHDGSYIVSGSRKGKVDIISTSQSPTVTINTGVGISSLAISPDGKILSLAATDGKVLLVDVAEKKIKTQFSNETINSPGVACLFSRDGATIYVIHSGQLVAWNTADGTMKSTPTRGVTLRLSEDGKYVVCMVGESSPSVFELIDLEKMEVVNAPAYKLY